MSQSLAAGITRAASKQTYYTIRLLVDRDRVDDAYRAYAYFRWVDDILDAETPSGPWPSDAERRERERFLDRQRWLLDRCLRGGAPRPVNLCEAMLVDLVRQPGGVDRGLEAYLRNMMLVMAFDLRRRGRLISAAELADYTRWLAIAVTEASHHFIGHGAPTVMDGRYLAASAAHVLHMLRDTCTDARAGYFNIPREWLEAHAIGPTDLDSTAYRAWVEHRVALARTWLGGGRAYLAHVPNQRTRLAGLAYMARFEWLLETLERDGFRVRPAYPEATGLRTGARISWRLLAWLGGFGSDAPAESRVEAAPSPRRG